MLSRRPYGHRPQPGGEESVHSAHTSVYTRVSNRRTPLHGAAVYGHVEAVEALLAAGGSQEAQNNVSDSVCVIVCERVYACTSTYCPPSSLPLTPYSFPPSCLPLREVNIYIH